MNTFGIEMLFFVFFLIFLFFLERLRNANKWKFCSFIPRTRLLRIAIIAQILAYIVKYVGLNPEINSWISLLARIGFYSAFSSWILDIIWWATKKFSSRKMSPPQILKDMSLIAISTLIFAIQLNDKGALTAIGSAAVIGALAFMLGPGTATQLSNISSAIVAQAESQLKVGDCVEIDGQTGIITNISSFSTFLYDSTKDRTIIFSNSSIDNTKIINFSIPNWNRFLLEIEVNLPLEIPPGKANLLLREAVKDCSEIVDPDQCEVLTAAYTNYSILYLVNFYINDFSKRKTVCSLVMNRIWYLVDRAGFYFPTAIFDTAQNRAAQVNPPTIEEKLQLQKLNTINLLRSIDLFTSLSDEEINSIVENDSHFNFGPGEIIIREGEHRSSMYVIVEGECSIYIKDANKSDNMIQVATLSRGSIIGEVSALTGDCTTATVIANGHLMLQEISQAQINRIFLANNSAMKSFASIISEREAHRASFSIAERSSFESNLLKRISNAFHNLFG